MKEKLMKCVTEQKVSYGNKLKKFLTDYFEKVDRLRDKITEENRVLNNELNLWLESEGYNKVIDAVQHMDENSSSKVEGFIEYYQFMLSMAGTDQELLMDLLFSIPEQFEREFCLDAERNSLGCRRYVEHQQYVMEYDYVRTQGTFTKVPCFI